jgi:nicotinamidase-related amidase
MLKGPLMKKNALIIIDMVKDYFNPGSNYPITEHAKAIIPPINHLIGIFRQKKFPVIFSTDAFQADDFLFKGKMHPHAIKGTRGAEVVDDLDMSSEDLWLPKPRFSAFFNTGLENILREQNVTSCAVAGIATSFCVLATAMDAVCHNFETVILEDCSAAFSKDAHNQCLDLYRKNPLDPLFRILTSSELIAEL